MYLAWGVHPGGFCPIVLQDTWRQPSSWEETLTVRLTDDVLGPGFLRQLVRTLGRSTADIVLITVNGPIDEL